jgi:hypothetical protein
MSIELQENKDLDAAVMSQNMSAHGRSTPIISWIINKKIAKTEKQAIYVLLATVIIIIGITGYLAYSHFFVKPKSKIILRKLAPKVRETLPDSVIHPQPK